MSRLCACGCGQSTRLAPYTRPSKGWVKGEPIRFIRGHQGHREPDAVRFWRNVNKTPGCWLWMGSVRANWYGAFSVRHRSFSAHRWSWSEAHGPIPPGMCVLHRCDTPRCVRPDHLFLGTIADNNHDMIAKGRYVPRKKGTWLAADKVLAIRDGLAAGLSTRAVAKRVGVGKTLVWKLAAAEASR